MRQNAMTLYEARLANTGHPYLALPTGATRRGNSFLWFTVEEAIPVPIDDEVTLPMSIDCACTSGRSEIR